jgi:hypothetical protein
MRKTVTIETASFKNRRIKVGPNVWISVSPFIDLSGLEFGKSYDIEVTMDKSGQFFAEEIKPAG